MDIDRALRSTGVAALATDAACRIIAFNEAAVASLGFAPREMMMRPCYDIVDGHDLAGIRFCSRGCPVRRAAGAGRPIDSLTLRIRRGPHGSALAEISSVVLSSGNGNGHIFVHFLRLHGVSPRIHSGERRPPDGVLLTRREAEVLSRIAAGSSVKELAFELDMSLTTARTHVRNVLRKFAVHRQIDAVLVAQRRGLL